MIPTPCETLKSRLPDFRVYKVVPLPLLPTNSTLSPRLLTVHSSCFPFFLEEVDLFLAFCELLFVNHVAGWGRSASHKHKEMKAWFEGVGRFGVFSLTRESNSETEHFFLFWTASYSCALNPSAACNSAATRCCLVFPLSPPHIYASICPDCFVFALPRTYVHIQPTPS